MRRFVLALATAVLMLSIGTGAAVAAPPSPQLKLTPDQMLNFGTVPVGSQVIKDVQVLNRTDTTLYYNGATYGWPGQSYTYPNGIWGWAGPDGNNPFPCYSIAPKSSCTLPFSFVPYEPGPFVALNAGGVPLDPGFALTYNTASDGSGTNYTSNAILMKGTGS